MTRFRYELATGVVLDATGRQLGRVETVRHKWGDALHWPLDAQGVEVRGPTMILSLAILAIARAAHPGMRVTLLDLDMEGGE